MQTNCSIAKRLDHPPTRDGPRHSDHPPRLQPRAGNDQVYSIAAHPTLPRVLPALEDERQGYVDLNDGLDVRLNVENVQGDPSGITTEYRLLIPALEYHGPRDENTLKRPGSKGRVRSFFGNLAEKRQRARSPSPTGEHTDNEDYGEPAQPAQVDGAYDMDHRYPGPPPTQMGNVAIVNQRHSSAPGPVRPPYDYPPASQPEQQANTIGRRSTQIGRYAEPQPAGQQPLYPPANPAAARRYREPPPVDPPSRRASGRYAPPGEAEEDGRPVRQRYRGDEYDEDSVPQQYLAEKDWPVSPPSQMPYDASVLRQEPQKARKKWLNWRI